MKKQILYGLAGILVMLLAQHPVELRAMDSGILGFDGYRGYEMGPGMMRYGGYSDDTMGPGMMNRGDEKESQYRQNNTYLDRKAAERIFEDSLERRHNPNLKLGEIKDEGTFFEAQVLTKDNSLVEKLIVDKNTGRMRTAY